jgi:hypothetical protein
LNVNANSQTQRFAPLARIASSPSAFAFCAALALLAVSVAPQCYLWLARGRAWNGTFVYLNSDERAYAAYVNALIDGRPRRNDPYTGRDAELDAARTESIFSVQPLPAYSLALTARTLHVSTSAIFFALLCVVSFVTPLIIFQLIRSLTSDARLACAGALCVLCLGTLATGYGVWDTHDLLEPGIRFRHLLFLRRYLPALPFPIFWAFCALVRRALNDERRRAAYLAATLAGLCFAALVYSYFYLWTTAAAWLCTLAILYLIARPTERRRTLLCLAIIATLATLALAPYGSLLARLGATAEGAQALTRTHAPDLFRVPELIGFVVLLLLAWAHRRGHFTRDDGVAFFAASLALLPFAVFNQQVITGLSLQPMHYDAFVANYCGLLAAVVAAARIFPRPLPSRVLILIALAALTWGSFETAVWARRTRAYFLTQDEVEAATARLAQLGRSDNGQPDTRSVVFTPNLVATDLVPTRAPQPVLWAPHTFAFAGASAAEEHERLLQYLYFSGVDLSHSYAPTYAALDAPAKFYLNALLGWARVNSELSATWRALTAEEIRGAFDEYESYRTTFSRERAARFPVTYLLVYDGATDWPNFDRWYTRDAGERVGGFTLYRVRLRAQ